MIIVVGGIKGGSGKTTICTNLAVMRSDKERVLLIDSDEQNSSSEWFYQRRQSGLEGDMACSIIMGHNLHKECLEIKRKSQFSDILIDVGGRDTTSQRSALCVADVFITPFQPRSLDLWTLGSLEELLKDIKTVNPNLKCFAVINRADSTGSDNKDVCNILSKSEYLTLLPVQLGQRKAFSNAVSEGLAVVELKRPDVKAKEEIKSLYKHIFNTKSIQENHRGNKRAGTKKRD